MNRAGVTCAYITCVLPVPSGDLFVKLADKDEQGWCYLCISCILHGWTVLVLPVYYLYITCISPVYYLYPTGDVFVKLADKDDQGWCKGRKDGRVGLYPDNYVEIIQSWSEHDLQPKVKGHPALEGF